MQRSPRTTRGGGKALGDHLYRQLPLALWKCRALKLTSKAGESESDFRIRLGILAHEKRDDGVEELRKRCAPKLSRLEERIRVAQQRVSREEEQYKQQKSQTMSSVGATILGVLFGRKMVSVGRVGRATTSMRGLARAAREKEDIRRAQESLEALQQKLADLESSFGEDVAKMQDEFDPGALEPEEVRIRPRKSDISIGQVVLGWTPWSISPDGTTHPLFP